VHVLPFSLGTSQAAVESGRGLFTATSTLGPRVIRTSHHFWPPGWLCLRPLELIIGLGMTGRGCRAAAFPVCRPLASMGSARLTRLGFGGGQTTEGRRDLGFGGGQTAEGRRLGFGGGQTTEGRREVFPILAEIQLQYTTTIFFETHCT
jgi:hypothetical protein